MTDEERETKMKRLNELQNLVDQKQRQLEVLDGT
jgi:hypothetical protein